MPEGLALAFLTEGLIYILLIKLLAGIVYGFAGFGSALIFIPLASIFVPPQVAVGVMAITAIGSVGTVLPPALRAADKPRMLTMLIPACVMLVPGIFVLRSMDVTPLRWLISGVIAISLAAMMFGWRRSVEPSPKSLAGLGITAGLIGGATGLLGPVIILFNLSGRDDVTVTRANTLCFLTLSGIIMIPLLALMGVITTPVMWLGLLATPVYMVGTLIGQRGFDPKHATLFRWLGYAVIGGAVLVGLPIWS